MTVVVYDDFLPSALMDYLERISTYTNTQSPLVELALDNDVSMFVKAVPEWVEDMLVDKLSEYTKSKIDLTAAFFRYNSAKAETKERVHCDYEILGEHPNRAAVLYLDTPPDDFYWKTGTAFWSHKDHGISFEGTDDEAQELLEDCSSLDFDFDYYVGHKRGRLLTYPTSYFHSRYPAKAWGDSPETGRWVLVMFYTQEERV